MTLNVDSKLKITEHSEKTNEGIQPMETQIPITLLTPFVLRDIEKVPQTSLPILEIFPTFEGEGAYIGVPQIFIRVSGCAVGCTWCDTKHSWNANGTRNSPARLMTIKEIYDETLEIAKQTGITNIHVSGGEPLHYPSQCIQLASTFRNLLRGDLLAHDKITKKQGDCLPRTTLMLESSGVLFNNDVFSAYDIVSLDIKGPTSGLQNLNALRSSILNTLRRFPNKIQLKFVVKTEDDIDWLCDKYSDLLSYDNWMSDTADYNSPLIITPCYEVGETTVQQLSEIQQLVQRRLSMCNIRFIPQIHKLLNFR